MPVYPVEWAWGGLVADRSADRFAANNALQPHCPHKPSDCAAGDVVTLPQQLSPDLAHAIDLEVLVEHPAYLDLHGNVASGAGRQTVHVVALGDDLIIGGRGNRQQSADRLDPSTERCASMKEIIASVGGRAPPSQNMQRLCAKSR